MTDGGDCVEESRDTSTDELELDEFVAEDDEPTARGESVERSGATTVAARGEGLRLRMESFNASALIFLAASNIAARSFDSSPSSSLDFSSSSSSGGDLDRRLGRCVSSAPLAFSASADRSDALPS